MSYFLCCLALALPALGQSRDATPIALFTEFPQPPSQGVVDAIQRDVANIMAPLGLPFEWKSMIGEQRHDVAVELAVVTFRGNCNIPSRRAGRTKPGPLGITHVTDGEVIPFAEVNCDRIRDFLWNKLVPMGRARSEAAFGRAVGRVTAHELFHIFAGTRHHGSGGVAEPFFTPNELMSDGFQFNTTEFRLLRASLKQARRQNSLLRSAASALSGRFIFRESGCTGCHGSHGEGTRSGPALHAGKRSEDAKTSPAKLAEMCGECTTRARLPGFGCHVPMMMKSRT